MKNKKTFYASKLERISPIKQTLYKSQRKRLIKTDKSDYINIQIFNLSNNYIIKEKTGLGSEDIVFECNMQRFNTFASIEPS